MPQNQLLADVLRRDINFLNMHLSDMTDAELAQRPVPAANNALWQLGHLIGAEASIVNGCAGRTIIELPAGFAERFKKSAVGENDVAKLATKDELLALFTKVRNLSAEWAATLSADDFAKPTPEKLRGFIPTVAHGVHLLTSHAAMHLGQIQVLRRKLGKPVMF